LRVSGLVALARRLRSDGVILCYHNVVPDGAGGPGSGLGLHMSRTNFERQVRWLAGTYELVSLGEFVARQAQGAPLGGVAALTFDDGYAGVFEQAWPLLQELRVPATVFVVANAPDRDEAFWWDHPGVLPLLSDASRDEWLTTLRGDRAAILQAARVANGSDHVPRACRPAGWDTIAAAACAGLGIGVHSATHRSLPALDQSELHAEVVASRETVARHTGVTPQFFAYPYGRWNERVREAVRVAGYRAAFVLDQGADSGAASNWSLRRLNVPAGIEDAPFQAWTAGLQPRRSA
jgi:peptidoglycan/xylan/chitin deacetylase (PgdA/CDA1 family)